jgi:basic membrane lipoprotein Med (substrate-binding protein (PBP1-ABC) superfamily)
MSNFRKQVRLFSTLAHIALAATLACSRAENGAPADAAAPLKVALLTPGPISDQSWNAGAYHGLMRIRDSLGASVSHIETRAPSEFDENFRQYGAQGYDIVFGHGFEFQDAARRVAPDYPSTVYIISSSAVEMKPNVAGLQFAFSEASYLAGLIAGSVTRSGIIGAIGGTELPPVAESFRAFALGARAVRPDVRVLTSYIGNWDDVSAGREQALAQIARRADVIFQNADAAGLGIFQAARQSSDVLVIGSNSNQNDVAPEVTLGSVVIDLPHAFLEVARAVRDRTFTARAIALGTESRVVTLVLNPALESRIPVDVRQRVDSLQRLMLDGKYRVAPADSGLVW